MRPVDKPILSSLSDECRARAVAMFERKALPDPNSGCWLWDGSLRNGYGTAHVGSRIDNTNRYISAHRLGWEIYNGEIPPGLDIDHRVCRLKCCVNPKHLALVTNKENLHQPDGISYRHTHKTHCVKGHPYSGDNLYVNPKSKGRYCRTCIRQNLKAHYHKTKAKKGSNQ